MPTWKSSSQSQPMRIQVAPNSVAAERYYASIALPGQPWFMPTVIAPGINPAPLHDLIFHGGKTVAEMEFQNVYLGSAKDWDASDIQNIEAASIAAMQDKQLNNVMVQYFPGSTLACDPREALVLSDAKPSRLGEPEVQAKIISLFESGRIADQDLDTVIFNLLLPRGSVLTLDESTSLEGLGGYHGSVHVSQGGKRVTLYYSACVYSEGQNGIPVFDASWKNVVGTLYHEMNEFRTDADVNDAITRQNNDFLGWMSREGEECGDQPIVASGANLQRIFQEVKTGSGVKTYVQFQYSNAVHGAEGPIAKPH